MRCYLLFPAAMLFWGMVSVILGHTSGPAGVRASAVNRAGRRQAEEGVASHFGNPFLFTGREYDAETGLYYYHGRYYSPALGRFINRDPAGYSAGDPNLYRYVADRPTARVDPTGQWSCSLPPITYRERDALISGTDVMLSADERGLLRQKCHASSGLAPEPTGVLPSDPQGFVCCENGELKTRTFPAREVTDKNDSDCIARNRQCLEEHESQHVWQIRLFDPDVCKRNKGTGVPLFDKECGDVMECFADAKSLECYLRQLQSGALKTDCRRDFAELAREARDRMTTKYPGVGCATRFSSLIERAGKLK